MPIVPMRGLRRWRLGPRKLSLSITPSSLITFLLRYCLPLSTLLPPPHIPAFLYLCLDKPFWILSLVQPNGINFSWSPYSDNIPPPAMLAETSRHSFLLQPPYSFLPCQSCIWISSSSIINHVFTGKPIPSQPHISCNTCTRIISISLTNCPVYGKDWSDCGEDLACLVDYDAVSGQGWTISSRGLEVLHQYCKDYFPQTWPPPSWLYWWRIIPVQPYQPPPVSVDV